MARTLCPDRERASIAVVAALITLFSTSSAAQIAAIALGGLLGLRFCAAAEHPRADTCRFRYRAAPGSRR
jgi:chromate transporter